MAAWQRGSVEAWKRAGAELGRVRGRRAWLQTRGWLRCCRCCCGLPPYALWAQQETMKVSSCVCVRERERDGRKQQGRSSFTSRSNS